MKIIKHKGVHYSHLEKLPAEILLAIFQNLNRIDAFIFSLSCPIVQRAYQLIKHENPPLLTDVSITSRPLPSGQFPTFLERVMSWSRFPKEMGYHPQFCKFMRLRDYGLRLLGNKSEASRGVEWKMEVFVVDGMPYRDIKFVVQSGKWVKIRYIESR